MVVDLNTRTKVPLLSHKLRAVPYSWSPDGCYLVIAPLTNDRWSHLYAVSPDGSRLVQLTNGNGNDSGSSVSPDGSHILFLSDRDIFWKPNGTESTYSLDLRTSEVTRLSGDSPIAWSPGGQYVLLQGQRQVDVADTKGKVIQTLSLASQGMSDVIGFLPLSNTSGSFPSNGNHPTTTDCRLPIVPLTETTQPSLPPIAFEYGNQLTLISSDGQKKKLLPPIPGSSLASFAWSIDGKHFILSNERNVYVQSVTDGELSPLPLTGEVAQLGALALSPNGKLLAYVRQDQNGSDIYLLNMEDHSDKRLTYLGSRVQRPYREIGNPVWSPDGTRLAATYNQETIAKIVIIDAYSGLILTFLDFCSHYTWAPDGAWINCITGRPPNQQVIAVSLDGKQQKALSPYGTYEQLSWSPDGRWLAVWVKPSSSPGYYSLWIVDSGWKRKYRLTFDGYSAPSPTRWGPETAQGVF